MANKVGKVGIVLSHSVVSDSLQPHGPQPPGSTVHGDSSGKNTGMGCHALFQESSQPRNRTQVSRTAGGFFAV